MATLITNIKQLVNVREESELLRGKELSILPSIENAYLIIENGLIAEYGNMSEIQNSKFKIQNNALFLRHGKKTNQKSRF